MTTKHTPGPWWIEVTSPGTDYEAEIQAKGDPLVPVYTLATVYDHDTARLIAASPELLEALEALLFVADGGYLDTPMQPAITNARTAIAKAKGE